MSEKLRLIISSGGTQAPLDYVRILTNKSRGTTGALLAEEAVRRGHNVDFVYSDGSKKPFSHAIQDMTDQWLEQTLSGNPAMSVEDLLQRVAARLKGARRFSGLINYHPVKDYDHYRQTLLDLVAQSSETRTAVVLAMAASDYGPEKAKGKISSKEDHLILRLRQLAKIISEVKKRNPDVFLNGFKLLACDSEIEELLAKAASSMQRDSQDLAVANIVDEDFNALKTYLVIPDGEPIVIEKRADLARILLDQIEQRISK